MTFFNQTGLIADWTEKCNGTNSCTIDLSQYVLNPTDSSNCVNSLARVFIQYQCALLDSEMKTGSAVIWGNIWIAITISIAFYIGFFWHVKDSKEKKEKFFSNKVDPSAYTLKFYMNEEIWG